MRSLGERIKYIRTYNKLTQEEFSLKTGVSRSNVSRIEKNEISPSATAVVQICESLNLSVEWVLTGEGDIYINRRENDADEIKLLNGFRKLEIMERSLILERVQTLLELKEAAEKEGIREEISEPAIIKHPAILPAEEPEEPEEEVSTIEMMVFDQKASAGLGNYLVEDASYEMLSFNEDEVPDGADFGVRIKGDSMQPHISDGSIVWVREQVQIENGQVGIFILNEEDAYCKKLYIDHDKHEVFLISYNPEYPPMKIGKEDFLRTVGLVL